MIKLYKNQIQMGIVLLLLASFIAFSFLPGKEEDPSADYANLPTTSMTVIPEAVEATEEEVTRDNILLNIPNIYQLPELPNGCEATSLAMVLEYNDFDITKTEIVDTYLDKATLVDQQGILRGADPEDTYIGNPYDETGYYILAPGLTNTAQAYLNTQDTEYRSEDVSGASMSELEGYVAQGVPVIVWVTLDFGEVQYVDTSWQLDESGEAYTPYANLHCEVLIGYDEEYFYLNDPLQGQGIAVKKSDFQKAYQELGEQAVVIEN